MVEVVIEPTGDGYRLTVDGADLSHVVRAGGINIQMMPDGSAEVILTLQPAQLRARLPEASVTAAESYLTGPTHGG